MNRPSTEAAPEGVARFESTAESGMPENENPPESQESPDVRTIRQLVRLMHRFDLTAIDLANEETKIRLRRRTGEPAHSAPPAPVASMPMPAPAAPQPVAPAPAPAAPSAPSAASGSTIDSPMVGTFYSSPAPDAPPFVEVGATVRAETTVCVIEAMKVFTDIPAGVSGKIVDVLVKNGQPVEFGQPLFRVEGA
jgi:acetyl-CoA carboxylase biotin carboxyl carrier protein